MPIYDELLGDVTDQERMARAAQKLRRREAFSTLGALSGDPYMAPWGRQQLQNLPVQGQGLARARQAAQSHQQRQREFQGLQSHRQRQMDLAGERLDLDRRRLEGTTLTPAPGMVYQPYAPEGQQWPEVQGWDERQQRQFERQMALKRAGAFTALQNQMELQRYKEQRMPESTEKTWRENQNNIFRMGDRLEKMRQWDKEGKQFVEPMADMISRGLADVGLEGLGELAAESHKGPEEMQARSWIAEDVAEKRKGLMGSAVTAYEGAKGTPWDPSVGGISQKESLRRYEDLMEALIYANAVMSYGLRIPGVKEDPYALPDKPASMTSEEFDLFNMNLQRLMSQGRGYPGATFPGTQAAQAAQATAPTTRTPPARPAGLTDEQWDRYLKLEGFK